MSRIGVDRRRLGMTRDGITDQPDLVVVGAGLAGLAAAATAARAGLRTVVLDARVPGGRARTDDRRGFRFNQGAHGFYLGGTGSGVLRRLGVTYAGEPPPVAEVNGLLGDVVSPFPFTPVGLARSRLAGALGKTQVARFFGLTLQRVQPERLADRSGEAWLAELGLRDDATAIVRTLTRVATYASDLGTISADAAARQLQLAVKPGVWYLDGGWQTLVDGLLGVALTAGADVRPHAPVVAVESDGRRVAVHVGRDEREVLHADAVVIAGLAPDAVAGLLPDAPAWSGLGPETTAACLDLGVRQPPSPRVLFGVDEPLYLSTHCPPADLAPPGQAVVHLMRYGARAAAPDRAQLMRMAAAVGITDDSVDEQRFLARMTVTHGAPVPGDGMRGRPNIDAAAAPGVFVCGDWVGPEGMLADAGLASAEAAAFAAARHVGKLAA